MFARRYDGLELARGIITSSTESASVELLILVILSEMYCCGIRRRVGLGGVVRGVLFVNTVSASSTDSVVGGESFRQCKMSISSPLVSLLPRSLQNSLTNISQSSLGAWQYNG
jgi:hypothetical protein